MLHELKNMSGYSRFAVVGLSCHVQAVRKLQVIKDDPEMKELFKGLSKVAEKLLQNLNLLLVSTAFPTPNTAPLTGYMKNSASRKKTSSNMQKTQKNLFISF